MVGTRVGSGVAGIAVGDPVRSQISPSRPRGHTQTYAGSVGGNVGARVVGVALGMCVQPEHVHTQASAMSASSHRPLASCWTQNTSLCASAKPRRSSHLVGAEVGIVVGDADGVLVGAFVQPEHVTMHSLASESMTHESVSSTLIQ